MSSMDPKILEEMLEDVNRMLDILEDMSKRIEKYYVCNIFKDHVTFIDVRWLGFNCYM